MGKYAALGDYLRGHATREVPMTFAEIERVIEGDLPPTASHHRAWWSNNPSNNVMTKVWLQAGFSSEQVDLERRRLVFRRVRDLEHNPAPKPAPASGRHGFPFGAMKGLVRVIDETDLTEPADPDWGGQN
ncbi:hypothetical protein ACMDCR_17445 [Labrys okinawensis]|uniref:DUF7662 domain-containing protein n=1 Tax=Labrys okinawensis TaxID=346911 RepID=UPI0039BD3D29